MIPSDFFRGRVQPPAGTARGGEPAGNPSIFNPAIGHRRNYFFAGFVIVGIESKFFSLISAQSAQTFAELRPATSRGYVKGFRLTIHDGFGNDPLTFAEAHDINISVIGPGGTPVSGMTGYPYHILGIYQLAGLGGVVHSTDYLEIEQPFETGDVYAVQVEQTAALAVTCEIHVKAWFY